MPTSKPFWKKHIYDSYKLLQSIEKFDNFFGSLVYCVYICKNSYKYGKAAENTEDSIQLKK